MRDDPKFNIKFVKTLEKYPCLYNSDQPDYSNKDAWNDAWTKLSEEIAEDVGECSVEECKGRWRNIRGCLTRYMRAHENFVRTGKKPIKKYYLFDFLQFVIPFTKKRESINFEDGLDSHTFDSSTSMIDFEQFKDELVDDDPLGEPSDELTATDDVDAQIEEQEKKNKKNDVYELRRNLKRYRNGDFLEGYCSPEDYWQLEVESAQSSSSNLQKLATNSDLDFFKSILGDIAHFPPKKKRQFKQKVLQLIDELADD